MRNPWPSSVDVDIAASRNILELNIEEVKALKRITFKEYISYEDPEAIAVTTKIYKWLQERGIE